MSISRPYTGEDYPEAWFQESDPEGVVAYEGLEHIGAIRRCRERTFGRSFLFVRMRQ